MGLLSAALGILDEAGEYVRARVGVPFVIQFGPGFTVTAAQDGGIDVMTVLPDTAAGGGLTDVTGTSPVIITTPAPGVRNAAVLAATASDPGLMPAADKRYADSTHAAPGAALTNANVTIQIGDGALRELPNVLTANHSATLGTTGAIAGDLYTVARWDTSEYTYAIINGGGGAGTLYTFAPYQTGSFVARYNGANWVKRFVALAPVLAGGGADGLMSGAHKAKVDVVLLPLVSAGVGLGYVPRGNEIVLIDAGDSITLPSAASTSAPITIIGVFSGAGGVVTADGSDTIIGAGTNAVAAGQAKMYLPQGPANRWAVITGVS